MRKTNRQHENDNVKTDAMFDWLLPSEAISSHCDAGLSDVLLYIMQLKFTRAQTKSCCRVSSATRPGRKSCDSDWQSYTHSLQHNNDLYHVGQQ